MAEHTFLVAFTVEAPNRRTAEIALSDALTRVPLGQGPFKAHTYLDSWWMAEDDRHDRSDLDSAVFVTKGLQAQASRLLERADLSPAWNIRGGA